MAMIRKRLWNAGTSRGDARARAGQANHDAYANTPAAMIKRTALASMHVFHAVESLRLIKNRATPVTAITEQPNKTFQRAPAAIKVMNASNCEGVSKKARARG